MEYTGIFTFSLWQMNFQFAQIVDIYEEIFLDILLFNLNFITTIIILNYVWTMNSNDHKQLVYDTCKL